MKNTALLYRVIYFVSVMLVTVREIMERQLSAMDEKRWLWPLHQTYFLHQDNIIYSTLIGFQVTAPSLPRSRPSSFAIALLESSKSYTSAFETTRSGWDDLGSGTKLGEDHFGLNYRVQYDGERTPSG